MNMNNNSRSFNWLLETGSNPDSAKQNLSIAGYNRKKQEEAHIEGECKGMNSNSNSLVIETRNHQDQEELNVQKTKRHEPDQDTNYITEEINGYESVHSKRLCLVGYQNDSEGYFNKPSSSMDIQDKEEEKVSNREPHIEEVKEMNTNSSRSEMPNYQGGLRMHQVKSNQLDQERGRTVEGFNFAPIEAPHLISQKNEGGVYPNWQPTLIDVRHHKEEKLDKEDLFPSRQEEVDLELVILLKSISEIPQNLVKELVSKSNTISGLMDLIERLTIRDTDSKELRENKQATIKHIFLNSVSGFLSASRPLENQSGSKEGQMQDMKPAFFDENCKNIEDKIHKSKSEIIDSLADYEFEIFASGGQAFVARMLKKDNSSGIQMIKIYDKTQERAFRREVEIFQSIANFKFLRTDQQFGIIQYAGIADLNDLKEYLLLKQRLLTEVELMTISYYILEQLIKVISRGFSHGDLKPRNIILFRNRLHSRLIDFGYATRLSPVDKSDQIGGTFGYIDPYFVKKGTDFNAVDLALRDYYSLGITLMELASPSFKPPATKTGNPFKDFINKMLVEYKVSYPTFRKHLTRLFYPDRRNIRSIWQVISDLKSIKNKAMGFLHKNEQYVEGEERLESKLTGDDFCNFINNKYKSRIKIYVDDGRRIKGDIVINPFSSKEERRIHFLTANDLIQEEIKKCEKQLVQASSEEELSRVCSLLLQKIKASIEEISSKYKQKRFLIRVDDQSKEYSMMSPQLIEAIFYNNCGCILYPRKNYFDLIKKAFELSVEDKTLKDLPYKIYSRNLEFWKEYSLEITDLKRGETTESVYYFQNNGLEIDFHIQPENVIAANFFLIQTPEIVSMLKEVQTDNEIKRLQELVELCLRSRYHSTHIYIEEPDFDLDLIAFIDIFSGLNTEAIPKSHPLRTLKQKCRNWKNNKGWMYNSLDRVEQTDVIEDSNTYELLLIKGCLFKFLEKPKSPYPHKANDDIDKDPSSMLHYIDKDLSFMLRQIDLIPDYMIEKVQLTIKIAFSSESIDEQINSDIVDRTCSSIACSTLCSEISKLEGELEVSNLSSSFCDNIIHSLVWSASLSPSKMLIIQPLKEIHMKIKDDSDASYSESEGGEEENEREEMEHKCEGSEETEEEENGWNEVEQDSGEFKEAEDEQRLIEEQNEEEDEGGEDEGGEDEGGEDEGGEDKFKYGYLQDLQILKDLSHLDITFAEYVPIGLLEHLEIGMSDLKLLSLKLIFCAECGLTDEKVKCIGEILKRQVLLTELIIEIKGSLMTKEGVDYLRSSIEGLKDLKLLRIDLSQSSLITDESVSELAESIKRCYSLEDLKIVLNCCMELTAKMETVKSSLEESFANKKVYVQWCLFIEEANSSPKRMF